MDTLKSPGFLSRIYSLSIVVPVYNEEDNIPFLIEEIRKVFPQCCEDHEIILVDDASTDRSGGILDALAGQDPRIRVIHNSRNRSLGGTLRAGFGASQKELILYLDADLPFDLNEVPRAIAILYDQEADLFSAYRISRKAEGVRRFLYSFVYNWIVDLFFRLGVKDVNFSFKLFKRSLLHEITLTSEGSFINVEMLVQLRRNGYKIVQSPVVYQPRLRGRSTLSSVKVIVRILAEFMRFFFSSVNGGKS